MSEARLLGCPFCQGTDVDSTFSRSDKGDIAAGCMDCGACGPDAKTEADAIAAWNRRSGGWVSVSERKPASGIHVAYYPKLEDPEDFGTVYSDCVDVAFYDADDDEWRGEYHGPAKPTHWRPLPAPPVAAEGVGNGE